MVPSRPHEISADETCTQADLLGSSVFLLLTSHPYIPVSDLMNIRLALPHMSLADRHTDMTTVKGAFLQPFVA